MPKLFKWGGEGERGAQWKVERSAQKAVVRLGDRTLKVSHAKSYRCHTVFFNKNLKPKKSMPSGENSSFQSNQEGWLRRKKSQTGDGKVTTAQTSWLALQSSLGDNWREKMKSEILDSCNEASSDAQRFWIKKNSCFESRMKVTREKWVSILIYMSSCFPSSLSSILHVFCLFCHAKPQGDNKNRKSTSSRSRE